MARRLREVGLDFVETAPVRLVFAREIRLKGGTRFLETILAAKEPEVYAYRADVTNAPGARALVEEWRLTPAGTGTRVQWTFAADGTGPFRLALKLDRRLN